MPSEKDLSIAIAYNINDIARLYRSRLDQEMAPHGLTRSQWWLLANLQYNNGVNQQALAEMIEMGKSATGKLIDQLEEKQWVERKPSKTDKRAYEIHLTAKTAPLLKDFDKAAHTVIENSLAGLPVKQRLQFKKLLDSIKVHLLSMGDD